MVTTLYIKYGSRITSGTAEVMYDRILQDDRLNHFFVNVNIDKLREHVADLLGVLTGGPDIYAGKDMKQAHAEFSITTEDFNNVAAHLRASLAEMGVAPDDIELLMAEVAKTAADIIST